MEYEGRGNSGDSGSFCPESFLSESCRLSNRAVNRLEEAGILTQGELAEFLLSHDIEDLHGLGRKCQLELEEFVSTVFGRLEFILSDPEDADYPVTIMTGLSDKAVRYLVQTGISTLGELAAHPLEDMPSGLRREFHGFLLKKATCSFSLCREIIQRPSSSGQGLCSYPVGLLASASLVSMMSLKKLLSYNLFTIGDLFSLPASSLRKAGLSELAVSKLAAMKESFRNLDLPSFFTRFVMPSADSQTIDVFLRRGNGESLCSIGKSIGVSNERVRQIALKAESTLIPFLDCLLMRLSEENPVYFTENRLSELFPDKHECSIIAYGFELHRERVEYLDFAALYIIRRGEEPSAADRISDIVSVLIADGAYISEIAEQLSGQLSASGLDFITLDMILSFCRSQGYHFYGDFVSKSSVPAQRILSMIVSRFFPDGIKLNQNNDKAEDDMVRLRRLAKKEFGTDLDDVSDKALGAALVRNDDILTYGRGRVISSSSLDIKSGTIADLKKHIDSCSDEKIYFISIFEAMKDELISSGIDNYYFLSGVLKHYLPDEYSYSRDYVLKKSGSTDDDEPRTDRIIRMIHEKGRSVSFAELKAVFSGFSDTMLILPMINDRRILDYGNRTYYAADMISVTDEERKSLLNTITSLLEENHGLVSSRRVLSGIEGKLSRFINDNQLDYYRLFSVIENFFADEFSFRRPCIYSDSEAKQKGVAGIFLSLHENDDVICRDQLRDYFGSAGISSIAAAQSELEILRNYIRIDRDAYVRKDMMPVTADEITCVSEHLVSLMDNGFIALSSITDFAGFPALSLPWNGYLLRSLCFLSESIRVLSTSSIESFIAVPSSFKGNYGDLAVMYLESTGQTSWTESQFSELLSSRGFIRRKIIQEIAENPRLVHDEEEEIWRLA